MLTRIPKHCHIARNFREDAAEARRQLKVWRRQQKQGRASFGLDWTVHLYHTKAHGWALVVCSPDYYGRT